MDASTSPIERPPPRLERGAISLERWRPSDHEELFAAIEDSLEHLRPWMAFAADHSRDSVERFLSDSDAAWERGEHFRYAIRDTRAALAGSAALMDRIGPGGLEIGYWVGAQHVRKGIATLATAALSEAGLALERVDHVEIHHDEANVASAAIPARLGFRRVDLFAAQPAAPAHTGRDVRWRLDAADLAASPARALLDDAHARAVTRRAEPAG